MGKICPLIQAFSRQGIVFVGRFANVINRILSPALTKSTDDQLLVAYRSGPADAAPWPSAISSARGACPVMQADSGGALC